MGLAAVTAEWLKAGLARADKLDVAAVSGTFVMVIIATGTHLFKINYEMDVFLAATALTTTPLHST